jgi:uncharacterized protein (TIGR03437 family)
MAGNGGYTYTADGPAVNTGLGPSIAIAVNPFNVNDSGIYVADAYNNRIYRIDQTTGYLTTIYQGPVSSTTGAGVVSGNPRIAVDIQGRVFFSDAGNSIWQLNPSRPPPAAPVSLAQVTVNTQPTGVQIMVDGAAYMAPQTFNWVAGGSHTLVAANQTGAGTKYTFSGWSTPLVGNTVYWVPSQPSGSYTVTASFTVEYQVTTSVYPPGSGTVQDVYGVLDSSGYAQAGTSVELLAVAQPGYQFLYWTGEASSSANALIFTLDTPRSVNAEFAQSQTIIFNALPPVTLGVAPLTLTAKATSGLPVTFSSTTPTVCTVSGSTVTIVATGTCSITAIQDGNSSYAPATRVTQSFMVSQTAGPVINSVANAEGQAPLLAANTWVDIKGTGLAPSGVSSSACAPGYCWQLSDFVNNQLPTTLQGVTVTLNGENAFVYYISMGQINILTPPDLKSGQVTVQVTNNGVASASFIAQAQTYSESFFIFGGGPYVIATHLNGSLVGPTTLYPGLSTPAQPGETIVIYANGFGSITTPIVSGSETQYGSLPNFPTIHIGAAAATVSFAGLVSPGLYQFNVVVPISANSGDNAIQALYAGQTTQSGTLITIQ